MLIQKAKEPCDLSRKTPLLLFRKNYLTGAGTAGTSAAGATGVSVDGTTAAGTSGVTGVTGAAGVDQ